MDKVLKLVLLIIATYLLIYTIYFIRFDLKYDDIQGIWITMYLVVFVVSSYLLAFFFEKGSNNVISSLFFAVVFGGFQYYKIFLSTRGYDLEMIDPTLKYGFTFNTQTTVFTEIVTNRFKTPEAIYYLVFTSAVIIGLYAFSKYNAKKKELEV